MSLALWLMGEEAGLLLELLGDNFLGSLYFFLKQLLKP